MRIRSIALPLVALAAALSAGAAMADSAQDYAPATRFYVGSGHRYEHARLADRHERGHERLGLRHWRQHSGLEAEHDLAHLADPFMTRREHYWLHRDLEHAHEHAHDRLDRSHASQHRALEREHHDYHRPAFRYWR